MRRLLVFRRSVLLGWLVCATCALSPLLAEGTHDVASRQSFLTARRGLGVEHEAVARLPHGTAVIVHAYSRARSRVTQAQGKPAGWVPPQYFAQTQPPAVTERPEMRPDHERRRFTRLQRKGIIATRQGSARGVLHVTINPFVWYRLTPQQQANFLRRAQRYFGGTIVEMHDERNDVLLARLTAIGEVEFAASPFDAPLHHDDTVSPGFPARTPEIPGSGR